MMWPKYIAKQLRNNSKVVVDPRDSTRVINIKNLDSYGESEGSNISLLSQSPINHETMQTATTHHDNETEVDLNDVDGQKIKKQIIGCHSDESGAIL